AEGSATVVLNLALAYREAGASVAIVDLDLRRPVQAKLFGLNGAGGFTDVLTGDVELRAALHPVAAEARGIAALAKASDIALSGEEAGELGGLVLLPTGPLPPNPQALLATPRARALLAEIAQSNDIVLIACPPLLS